MDHLTLLAVTRALDRSLAGASFAALTRVARFTFRVRFDGSTGHSVVFDLTPANPWIGRPFVRGRATAMDDPHTREAASTLAGCVVGRVRQPGLDRALDFELVDGRRLVAELTPNRTNLFLLDEAGTIVFAARPPRGNRNRRARVGASYEPLSPPRGRVPLSDWDAARLREALGPATESEDVDAIVDRLLRATFGLTRPCARFAVTDWRRAGGDLAEFLLERLRSVGDGACPPVVLSDVDPTHVLRGKALFPKRLQLVPWEPETTGPGTYAYRRADAAGTAGLYHETRLMLEASAGTVAAIRAGLDRAARKLDVARRRARDDLARFEDPDRYRRQGEALLAGLGVAQRRGGTINVPDPYGSAHPLSIADVPGEPLTKIAERLFASGRRAERGIKAARGRIGRVERERERLLPLIARAEEPARSRADVESLQREAEAVGVLVSPSRTGRSVARKGRGRPRLDGIRVFRTSDDHTVLAGRGGRENDRLTFRIAAKEDFWFHAAGVAGAHVVLRNPGRSARPSARALEEAAAVAAYYSRSRDAARVDVQWTRCKFVRRLRGAAPGTVKLKRFETTRVRPRIPPAA